MFIEMTVEQFLKEDRAIAVDVRSPIEFHEGSIPGAINLPLFSNEERAEIGTIYKHNGEEAAKWRAMQIVSPKIPYLMESIKKLGENDQVPVIHCWRGGMRSKAVCTFLEFSGIPSIKLAGGYKNYRQYILDKVQEYFPEKAIVIHGKTGVGKTEILHQLKAKGYPVLDLEAIAGHRGSIFGSIGLGKGNNQKNFDALLFLEISKFKKAPFFLMEAESKRIGRVVQPQVLLNKKESGFHLLLETSIPNRVNHIMNEYVEPFYKFPWFKEQVQKGIEKITKRLHVNSQKDIQQCLFAEDWFTLIQKLLEDYYDPRYDYKRSDYKGEFINLKFESIDKAVEEIEKYLLHIENSIKIF